MSYLTLADLLESPGASELAQVAGPDHLAVVSPELLIATLTDASRSAWTVDDQAAADAARTTIEAARDDAGQLIDGYLRVRYALPLNPVPPVLRKLARHIARYELHRYRVDKDHVIAVAYRDAISLLIQMSRGTVTLGVDDPVAPTNPAAAVEFVTRTPQLADSLHRI